MRFGLAVTLASSLWLAACAPVAGEPATAADHAASLGAPVTLKPGEVARVASEQAQIRFERVVADSRCPRDVQCIMAGEATVRIRLTLRGQAERTLDLRTTPDGEQTAVDGYVVRLADLVPLAKAGERVKDADYRATFVLTAAAAK
ncbi:MAG: hypothetical protein U0Q11_12895 [Vicinamibacterales bacterium]